MRFGKTIMPAIHDPHCIVIKIVFYYLGTSRTEEFGHKIMLLQYGYTVVYPQTIHSNVAELGTVWNVNHPIRVWCSLIQVGLGCSDIVYRMEQSRDAVFSFTLADMRVVFFFNFCFPVDFQAPRISRFDRAGSLSWKRDFEATGDVKCYYCVIY